MSLRVLTSVVQCQVGVDLKTGQMQFAPKEITTRYEDHADPADRWEDLNAEEQAEWARMLTAYHGARVASLSLPFDHRFRFERACTINQPYATLTNLVEFAEFLYEMIEHTRISSRYPIHSLN